MLELAGSESARTGGGVMTTQTIEVRGMTCAHCVRAVTSELDKIDGVSDIAIDLTTGVVTFASVAAVPSETLAAAIDEAGYELAT
jgi:copper chaperone CopZ